MPPRRSPAGCRAALCWPLLSAPRPAPGPGCGVAWGPPAHAWHRDPPGLLPGCCAEGRPPPPQPRLLQTFLGALGVQNKPLGAVGEGTLPAPCVGHVGHGAGDEAATRSLLLAPRPRSVPRFPPEHTAGQRPQGDAGGTDCTHGTRECAKSGVAPPAAAAQHHSGPRGTQDLAFSFASCKLSKPWGVPCGLHKRPGG